MHHPDTDRVILTHVLWATGAGLIPLPLIDFAAVTAIQVDLLNSLCRLHGVDFGHTSGKSLVAALTGTSLARIGASLLKGVPGIGTLVGGLSMSVMSGASTWAVGRVAAQQLEAHGTLFDIDLTWARQTYEAEFETGKKVAEEMRTRGDDAKDAFEKLERLGKLRESGVLTDAEFEAKKAELLGKIV